MSNVRDFPDQNRREKEAGLWISRIDRGLSSAETEELGRWLADSEANYRALVEVAELWDEMDMISMLSEICPMSDEQKKSARPYVWPVAASIILAVMAAVMWNLVDYKEPRISTDIAVSLFQSVYTTKVGEQSSFNLPDGTQIMLNTGSSVSVIFTDSNRLMILKRGEIHVHVAHEPSRPLSVVVGNRVLQAVGTEFNLEITSDQSIELIVTDGLVLIGVMDVPIDELPSDEAVILAPTSTLVAAGQEVTIEHVENDLEQIEAKESDTKEIAVKLSWREGNLIFRGETLEEAIFEIGRYTAVEFVFLDEKSKKERVAGLFKAGDVEGLLAVLRKNFSISYEWVEDNKVVLRGE